MCFILNDWPGGRVERQVAPVEPVRKDGPACRTKDAWQIETDGCAKKEAELRMARKSIAWAAQFSGGEPHIWRLWRGCRRASCCTAAGGVFWCRENAGCRAHRLMESNQANGKIVVVV
jgi:hypothetical protein